MSGQSEEVAHRGVRWRRSAGGRLNWYNEGLGRWVEWRPGADAPPLPPAWASEAKATEAAEGQERGAYPPSPKKRQANAMAARLPMRSPYRVVPIVIAILIVAVAIWQGTRPPKHAGPQDVAAARALDGQCLVKTGGQASSPRFSPVPVACSQHDADVKVVAVLVPGHSGSCPSGSMVVQVLQPGVIGEPSECVVPARR